MCSIGNRVNNIVLISMYGFRWVLEIQEGPLCKAYDCLTTIPVHLKLIHNNIECKLQFKKTKLQKKWDKKDMAMLFQW